jgi:hypothetical protein
MKSCMIIGMANVSAGDRFGQLTVISELPPGLNDHSRLVLIRCDCGTEKTIRRDHLRRSFTSSCGCLKRPHGHADGGIKSPTYRAWNNLMTRTTYVGSDGFKYHGAMGVETCMRWRNNFANFLEDMGEKPDWADGGIDRIDPWGNYSCGKCLECRINEWPTNCRWSTRSQQVKNQRRYHPRE